MKILSKTDVNHLEQECYLYTVKIENGITAEVLYDAREDTLEILCLCNEDTELVDTQIDEDALIDFLSAKIEEEEKREKQEKLDD